MNPAVALSVVGGFALTLEYLDLPGHARSVVGRSRNRDNSLGDQEKEKALQRESGHLFRLLGILVGGSL